MGLPFFPLMTSTYLRGCDVVPNIPQRQNRLEIIQWQLDICNEQPACAAVFSVIYQKCLAKLNNREFTPLRLTYDYLTACMMKQHSMYAVRKAMKWLMTVGLVQDCRKGQTRFLKNAKPDNAHYVSMDWNRVCELLQSNGYELPPVFKEQSAEELKAHLLKTTSGLFGTPKPIREDYPRKGREKTTKRAKVAASKEEVRSVESNRPIRNESKESEDSLDKTPNPLPAQARAKGNAFSRSRTDTIDFTTEGNIETRNYNISLLLENPTLCDILSVTGVFNIQSPEARRLLRCWAEGVITMRHLLFLQNHSNPPQLKSVDQLVEYCKQINIPDIDGFTKLQGYTQQLDYDSVETITSTGLEILEQNYEEKEPELIEV